MLKIISIISKDGFSLGKYLPALSLLAGKLFIQPDGLEDTALAEFFALMNIEYQVVITQTGVQSNKINQSNQNYKDCNK